MRARRRARWPGSLPNNRNGSARSGATRPIAARWRFMRLSRPGDRVGPAFRVRPAMTALLARAFESQLGVVLVAVEAGLGERGRAHGDRLGPFRSVIVAAEGEAPLGARLRLAAARGERRPGNAPFD